MASFYSDPMKNLVSKLLSKPICAEMKRVFMTQRLPLIAFLARLAHIWMRLPRDGAAIRNPRQYLCRMAKPLAIDRERSRRQKLKRNVSWLQVTSSGGTGWSEPLASQRASKACDTARQVFETGSAEGGRVAKVFARHRVGGLTQRGVAAELGVSLATVEGDLRRAYAAIYSHARSGE